MTVKLADYLIGLDKYVIEEGKRKESFSMNTSFPMDIRLTLSAPEDLDQNLMVNIKESMRKSLKISFHHQDDGTKNGLLRVDYGSRHLNPFDVTASVPDMFRPFAGLWLDGYPGHIHYVVDGYKPLAWALPLEFDGFPVKGLTERVDYMHTLDAFFDKINLKTKMDYGFQTRLL